MPSLSAHVADGWVKPDALKGLVDAHNLFGTPAANRRVEATLTLNPTFPAFRNWPDYQFYDVRHAKDGYTTQASGRPAPTTRAMPNSIST